jgi:hypothetical protein
MLATGVGATDAVVGVAGVVCAGAGAELVEGTGGLGVVEAGAGATGGSSPSGST